MKKCRFHNECSTLNIGVNKITSFSFFFLFCSPYINYLAYRVQLRKCTNVKVNEAGLAVCIGENCRSVLGSVFVQDNDQVVLRAVREVLFRPLGSYIQGKFMHNVNTCRMMYAEMLESGSFNSPRTFLDIPHHTIEPRNAGSTDEPENILQVASRKENAMPKDEDVDPKPRIRVKDFGSMDLYGPDKKFLARIVLNDYQSTHSDLVVASTGSDTDENIGMHLLENYLETRAL